MHKSDSSFAVRPESQALAALGVRGQIISSQVIARSWERSHRHGLSTRDRVMLDAPIVAGLSEVEDRNVQLLNCANPEMEQLHSALAPQGWLLACIDLEGVVLNSLGNRRHELSQIFRVGAQLSEQHVGTSAASCVLAEQESVVVNGEEHFLEEARIFSCLATPIFGLSGDMVGVLDLSGKGVSPSQMALESLQITARAIENRMFSQLGDVLLVHVHHRPDMLGTPLKGLLAFDQAGKLKGANRIASQLLSLGKRTTGVDFADLFDQPFVHAACYRRDDLSAPFRLCTQSGVQLYACITTAPMKTVRPAAPADISTSAQGRRPDVAQGPCLEDPVVQESLQRGRKAFERNIPVLINGETGTGKEVFARLLHEGSRRAGGAFVAINCSSIPASLIESELFGYVEGAFTGSRKGGATGKIEQAHKGTLFLDEIGDMPLELQGRLLRVLQERSLNRLGSTQVINVDCALICATHRDLKLLTANQGFREDLYYRINGLRVTLPVLHERRDLPQLIRHLLHLETVEHPRVVLGESALQALLAYRWPGNIRQLYQTLRLAAALAEDEGVIGLHHLPDEVLDGRVSEIRQPLVSGEVRLLPRDTLQVCEQRMIRAAVDACGGNLSAAARNLGIARATLYRKLKLIGEGAETMADPVPWSGLDSVE